MPRYNLLDEKWIQVAGKDTVEKVSIKELFAGAAKYKELAGDMKTQDFAVMRVMLAVLHTVFSRFDASGEPYEFFDVDSESFLQIGELEENYLDDYEDALYQTWIDIWNAKEFPKVVDEYLEKWRERFFLYDDKYPFFQVTKEVIEKDAAGGGEFYGKNINRLVSESANKGKKKHQIKYSIFSPKESYNKEYLTDDEVVRWLITLQGYSGTSDKKKVGTAKTYSKGWLYDLGGVYLKGDNLFETMMLNFVIVHDEKNNLLKIQKPCWERESISKNINSYFHYGIDNIASLYTTWSREIFIDQKHKEENKFVCATAKLPELEHNDAFLEPMTVWAEDKKGIKVPKKHSVHQSIWRSFGLLTGAGEGTKRPGVIEWLNKLNNIPDLEELNKENITICVVSMLDDGTSTSWAPVDEIVDTLNIKERILVDIGNCGWVNRINYIVSKTKEIIEKKLGLFLENLMDIRKIDKNIRTKYKNKHLMQFYFNIDLPFRLWIDSIDADDDKDKKEKEWIDTLKRELKFYVGAILSNATFKDYKGIEEGGKIKNIATIYNFFLYTLKQKN